MSARRGILAGGNWIVDKIKFVDVYPREEALANIGAQTIANGGSPFNLLVDLAKLGAPFPLAAVGLVGQDEEGRWVRERCEKHGIDVTHLAANSAAPTSYTDVFTVRATGRRTFFHQRGANALLGLEHFQLAPHSARIFHLGYLLLLDRLDEPDAEFGTVAARLLHDAQEAGFLTSIDVVSEDGDRFAQVVLPALKHTDYCLLNEFEAERTAGIPIRTASGIDYAALRLVATKLLEAGVRRLVAIHFPEGAAAMGRDGILHVHGSVRVPQENIVSTVGAGDAFAAGLLCALHEEMAIELALECAVCAAAACLAGAGASDGIKGLEECRILGRQWGYRDAPSAES